MAALLMVVAAGCSSNEAGGPGPAPEPPPSSGGLATSGTYDVITTIDLTVASVLPASAASYVEILADFRRDPAETLFRLLDDAGVPLVAELRAVLPDVLEAQLAGWLSDAILDRPAVAAQLDALLTATQTTLVRFDLASELVLGDGVATHRLLELRFGAASVPLPDLGSVVAEAHVTAGATGADAHLSLGEHAFGVRLGDAAVAALEASARATYGVGFREAVGRMVDCPAVAADVAGICLLGICVGHAAELAAICEDGIDLVVDELYRHIRELDIDVLRLAGGEASMVDGPVADGRVDRLVDGVWDAELDFGLGLRPLRATFTAVRR